MPRAASRTRRRPDDPSPLDFCGWCFQWIARDAHRPPEPLDRTIASPGNPHFFEGRIDGRPVFGIVPQRGCIPAYADAGAIVILCSEECRAELLMAVARHEGRVRGENVAPHIPTTAERAEAEDLMKDHCAWCLAAIAEDAPVETVPTRIPNLEIEAGGIFRVNVGDRMLHARAVPPGFLLEHPDHNVLFVTCSPACAEALTAAVRDDIAS